MATEAQKRAQKEYDKKNRRKFTINLNYNTDADLIAYIESWDNIQRGFKQLLWREIGRISKREVQKIKGGIYDLLLQKAGK